MGFGRAETMHSQNFNVRNSKFSKKINPSTVVEGFINLNTTGTKTLFNCFSSAYWAAAIRAAFLALSAARNSS
jgi:predicted transcriptional regulator of viral defense system